MSARDDEGKLICEADMDAALRSHYRRKQAEAVDPGLRPDQRLMSIETEFRNAIAEQGEEEITDYEMRFMARGYRLAFDHVLRGGPHPGQILKHLFARGRQVFHPFFSSLSMTESGLMFSETKAGHSFRCKLLSGEIKLSGMKGYRLPGQKTPLATPKYAAAAARTRNRAKKPKQGSFLRKLKLQAPSSKLQGSSKSQPPKTRQGSFIRKLSGGENGTHRTDTTNAPSRSAVTTGTRPSQISRGGAVITRSVA